MPDVYIKTPNLDDVFEKWKNSAVRKNKKKMEKEFGTKGSVFSLNNISAAESVKEVMKEAAIYFAIKRTIAPSKDKDENLVIASKLNKETFYTFKDGQVNKDNWKGKEAVPTYESIKAVKCKECGGKGFTTNKCKECGGSGKIKEKWTLRSGEDQDKLKTVFEYPCGECYGTGSIREQCKECGGHQFLYKYEILPVPFKTVVTGIPVLHSSAKTKFEREIEQDLHKLIKEVEGIKFNDFKSLEKSAEPSLGYWNKNIKKTVSVAGKDYSKYKKDKEAEVITQIYLFPMLQLFCESKKGNKFEIYSLGSEKKFMIYSNF